MLDLPTQPVAPSEWQTEAGPSQSGASLQIAHVYGAASAEDKQTSGAVHSASVSHTKKNIQGNSYIVKLF